MPCWMRSCPSGFAELRYTVVITAGNRKTITGRKLTEKAGRGTFVALLLFVGIPLPGTGAWTGTLAASILDMDFKSTITAVMLGVLLAGVIMMTASVVGFSLI